MLTHLRPALALLVLMTVLTGVLYPLAITGVAQVAMPAAANGSLVERDGRVVGSALIGQPFAAAGYLHPRPSASGYNAAGSGASNLGPTNAALITEIGARADAFRAANAVDAPIDAVTASASGLDPHVSPDNANAQAERIATARNADAGAIRALVAEQTEGRFLGLFGEARVNVLAFNLALDEAFPLPPSTASN